MTLSTPNGATTFGYLSAVESADHGFFGGYLLVSPLGRPIEFHCTAPIRPSRAQEILYGPTLQPYLLGEQIAGALLATTQAKPRIILTDQLSVLCQRAKYDLPFVCLLPSGTDATAGHFSVIGHVFELPIGFEHDRDAAIALLAMLGDQVDLPEPFARIHEAIREAQRIDERGTDGVGEAA